MELWNLIMPLLLYGINLISIITLIFVRRKDMSVTFAWLLVLIFLPLLGFILYFFFGSTYKLRLMSKKFRMEGIEEKYGDALKKATEAISAEKIVFQDPETKNFRDMIIMNSRNSKCFFTEDNDVQLLVNGQEKFPRMFQDIEAAKESIHVMYFIIKSKDQIGKDLIALLAKKAAQGVEVKVLFDGMGCMATRFAHFKPIIEAGGQVQRFLPSMFKTLIELNYRLHRKMVIIDSKIAYTGGINVGDDYLGLYPKISPWRDTSVRVTGTAVKELQMRFFADWIFCEKQNKKMKGQRISDMNLNTLLETYFSCPVGTGTAGVQIISCGPDSKYATHRDSYMKIASSARKYLYLQTPYFIPDQGILDTLRLAAQSGIDVRVMIPGIADKQFVYYVTLSYIQELLESGIKVYKHKGFLHAKTFVIDDHVASIGTTNLDIRSFKLDYEVNTLIYHREFAQTCRDTFLNDIEDSTEITLREFEKRGRWSYFCESLCRFIAPLS